MSGIFPAVKLGITILKSAGNGTGLSLQRRYWLPGINCISQLNFDSLAAEAIWHMTRFELCLLLGSVSLDGSYKLEVTQERLWTR